MIKNILTFITLVVASELILSACAAQGSSPGLKAISWRLVSYGPPAHQILAAAGIQTNVDFYKHGTVDGNVGCNSFSGNYEVKSGNIVFSMILSTMMACHGSQMDQERVPLKVLTSTVRYQVQGNSLVIYAADGASSITLSKR